MERVKKIEINGRIVHYGVGAIIKKDGKYLLIDRAEKPYGFACITGHVRKGERPEEALAREVKEEVNLEVLSYELMFERMIQNRECQSGKVLHHTYIFDASVKNNGKIKPNDEVKSVDWYSPEEIKYLKLEPLWRFFFKKMKVI
ncbi:MAG: NUDIX domain-containing protein [Nanoarchaeota archaeon]|mgnify:FL=1